MRHAFDLSVYFIADPACCGGRDIVDVTMKALAGGATMVQLRNKLDAAPLVAAQAAMLAELLKTLGVPFLVNDHVEIARDCGADGAHIGQGDMDVAEARRILGEEAILGLTAYTAEHIKAVDPALVDYIGTGPVYETQTKKGKPVLGPERFGELVALSSVPVVGIGGIEPENARAVIEAGAQGVAMIRSISEAPDPQRAAQDFCDVMKAGRAA